MKMDLTNMISNGTEADKGRICSQEAAGKRRGMG